MSIDLNLASFEADMTSLSHYYIRKTVTNEKSVCMQYYFISDMLS